MTTKQIIFSVLILGATTNIALGLEEKTSRQQDILNRKLLRAATRGDIKEVKKYLTDGADINCVNQDGLTALHINIQNIKSLYIGRSYSTRYTDIMEREDIIVELIKNGIDVNAQEEIDNESAMHFAAQSCDLKSVKEILKNNGNFNLKNRHGHTPKDIIINKSHESERCHDVYRMYVQELTQINLPSFFNKYDKGK